MLHPEVTKALDELARKSPDEIADFFRGQGIAGVPRIATLCPVAQYIRQTCGVRNIYIGACQWSIELPSVTSEPWAPIDFGTIPASVQDFIDAFDTEGFPDLIEPPPLTPRR